MKTSTVDVIIGMQFGDEGKGKIANQLASTGNYDYVIRFNGGGNAGHTIYLNGQKIVTHLIPCGILHNKVSVIGPGCVLNIDKFFEELEYLKNLGFDTSLVKVAENCHIVTKEHIEEDSKDTKIGTTRTGNGPCYRDKFARTGIRAIDCPELSPYLTCMPRLIHMAPARFLAEGAQGYWLDIDYGDYPYVTSSNIGVGALLNNGFNHKQVNKVIGVSKCYSTYVGNKNFTYDHEDFEKFREIGDEYGATTGRARQINWLNIHETAKGCLANGVDKLIINKMDVYRQTGAKWKFVDVHKTHELDSEEDFKVLFTTVINDIVPNLELEFQGSPE
jgi:adenylosuccinate synthase